MYQGFTKKLTASLIVAALGGVAYSAHAEQEFDVIVKLKNQSSPFSISAAQQQNMKASLSNPVAYHKAQASIRKNQVNKFVNQAGIQPKFIYSNTYYGFAAKVDQSQMEALQRNPNVEAVYRDKEYQLLDSQNQFF